MRTLLASAPHADTFGYSMPPPGLLRLGGAMLAEGLDVALEDLAFRLAEGTLPGGDELASASAAWLLRSGAPDVLGLSVMGATVPIALAIAERVKRAAPRTWVLLGGPGTTGVDVALLERFGALDGIVRGEGERTLPELVARRARGESPEGVAGCTWRADGGRIAREADRRPLDDLSALPPYAFALLPSIAEYKRVTGEVEGLVPVDSGRGCVYDCSFCTIGRFWGRRSRPMPVARLVEEISALRAMPGAKRAYLCHDLFGADRRHAIAFCERMVELEVGVPFEVRARVDHLDRELLAAMGRAGCYRVLLGVESADPAVRRLANKATADDLDVLAAVDACSDAGITPILSLILGLPGEDSRALARSLDLAAAAALRAGVNLSLHLPNPQPGCALGEEQGADARPVEGIPPDMALGTGTTAEERALIRAHPDLFSTFALLPLPERRLRELHDLATTLPEILHRFARTFAVLRRLREEDSLRLWRAWRATDKSFEAFALAHSDDPRVASALAWERARVRAAAAAEALPVLDAADARDAASRARCLPRRVAVLVESTVDLAALASALVAGEPLPPPGEARRYAVVPSRGAASGNALPGIRTAAVGDGVAAVLEALDAWTRDDAAATLGELARARPSLASAVERLAAGGLVALVPPPARTAPAPARTDPAARSTATSG